MLSAGGEARGRWLSRQRAGRIKRPEIRWPAADAAGRLLPASCGRSRRQAARLRAFDDMQHKIAPNIRLKIFKLKPEGGVPPCLRPRALEQNSCVPSLGVLKMLCD